MTIKSEPNVKKSIVISFICSAACVLGSIPIYWGRDLLLLIDEIWPFKVTLIFAIAIFIIFAAYSFLVIPVSNIFSSAYAIMVYRQREKISHKIITLTSLLIVNIFAWSIYIPSALRGIALILSGFGPQ